MAKLKVLLLILGITTGCSGFSQKPAFIAFENDPWVKTTLGRMTLQEKIGQLIIIDVYPAQNNNHKQRVEQILQEYKPGGIIIMNGSPVLTATWINDFQRMSGIPLLTAIDCETGPGYRLDSIFAFPNAQSLGAVQDVETVYKMGKSLGKQLKALGFNMSFAPVADINTNPDNPVISLRSFGENRENVALKAIALTRGLQEEHIAAVAKHFPGHGDTQTNSHKSLPVIIHPVARLDSIELYPFRKLAEAGIAGIMTGHLNLRELDTTGRPASLSFPVVNGLLREKTGFKGLIITDAMRMKAITLPPGKAEVQALKAGNDLLVMVEDISKTISEIEKAVASGTLSVREIDSKCRKVLSLKRWLGLHNYHLADITGLTGKLNLPEDQLISRQLTEKSLTVLKNQNLLPLENLHMLNIATVAIGEDTIAPFQRITDRYTRADHFFIANDALPEEIDLLAEKLKSYNLVIAGILNLRNFPGRNFGITESQKSCFRQLVSQKNCVILFFGNAYAVNQFPDFEKPGALVMAYQADSVTQELTAQLVFGAFDAGGKLPITITPEFPAGSGIRVTGNKRFKYTLPEETGISSELLNHKIDSFARVGLDAKAYPGCQVLIAREGKVILHKCYGYLSYDQKEPVTPDLLYDFASVSKVSGPLPMIIKLADEGRLDPDRKMSDYLPLLKDCNKENIILRDVLAHQAQLPVLIPFWQSRLAGNRELREQVFSERPLSSSSVRVSSRLWMERRYIDTMYQEIRNIPLLPKKKYRYTCMGFTLFPLMIEQITSQPYESYLKSTIYKPLGAFTLTYNPYKYFPVSRMVPTESDDYFRMEVLRGFVHDEGAAMLGGISGNAGLFGSVTDLAKLWQMYLWKGYYGGTRFFSEKTFDEFNRVQFPENDNRRGLGFDKPMIGNDKLPEEEVYPCKSAGPNSFGHSGYTGTFVWADPDKEFLFILFTNRVHPTRNNDMLSTLRIRGSMLQAIYDSIEKGIN